MYKKNFSRLLVIVMVFSLMATISGCGKIKDKVGEKIAEKATEKLLGDNVDITKEGIEIKGEDGGSFRTGEDLDWPDDVMNDIPEFKKGNIISIWGDGKNCTMLIEDGDEDDVEDYIKKLKDMDFEDGFESSDNEIIMYSGTRQSEEDTITVTYSKTDKTVSITYNQNQE